MIDSTHSSEEREEVRGVRESGRTSVLVIGGGINGISTFRDLALQGVDVVLVERGDFASGASAASSHMIHGGIRYLENGEFRLVRESVKSATACSRSPRTTSSRCRRPSRSTRRSRASFPLLCAS
jgi:glycerol-3-phosphate dehydrogenase